MTHASSKDIYLPVARGTGGQETSIQWGPWKWILLLTSLFVVAYSLVMISTAELSRSNWPLQISIISLIWLTVYFSCTFLQFKTAYLLTTSYVITLVLFHLGITIPDAIGIFKENGWQAGSSSKWLELSGWCTVLAMGSLGFGFAIGLRRQDFTIGRHIVERHAADKTLAILYSDGIGLLVASGVFLGLAIASFGNLINYSRVDFFRGIGDTRGLGIFLLSFPSAVVALVIGATTTTRRRFAAVIGVLGVALILLSGYRGEAMFPLLVGVILWVKTGRKISSAIALGTLVFSLIAVSAMGILRNLHAYKDIDSETLMKSVQESTLQDAVSNMGETGGVLAEVIRLVPAQDPYRYGQSYWLAIKSSIPNVLPQMRESVREAGKREARFDVDAINKLMPSDWLTYRLEPDKFDVGEGVGFTGIGEPYLNFGYPGVVVFFIGLGFYFSRIETAILLRRPRLLVFCGTMMWFLITTVRNESSNFIRPAMFIFLIICAWRMVRSLLRGAR